MTTAVQELISRFDQLNEQEQREAAREILLRTSRLESPPLTDEELTALADERFLELDRREANA